MSQVVQTTTIRRLAQKKNPISLPYLLRGGVSLKCNMFFRTSSDVIPLKPRVSSSLLMYRKSSVVGRICFGVKPPPSP
ncbi:MAG: hypothetical protein AAB655_00755 [Patescibacteria group bacterium]